MSVELISVLIAVLAIGATLAGVILTSVRGLRQDMQAQMGGLRGEIAQLRERMAHLEGLLEGLREAIARPDPPPARQDRSSSVRVKA